MTSCSVFAVQIYGTIIVIATHITLVSPFSDIPEDKIFEHIETVTKTMKPFQIHLHGLKQTDDHLLFLLVKEGKEGIVKIQNLLYSGVLSSLEQKNTYSILI